MMVKIMERLDNCRACSISPRATAERDFAAKTMAKIPNAGQQSTVLKMAQTSISVGLPAVGGGTPGP